MDRLDRGSWSSGAQAHWPILPRTPLQVHAPLLLFEGSRPGLAKASLDCSINLQQRVALGREGLGAQGGVAIGDQAQRRPLLSTEQIACAEDLSTYWRRAMPTLGHLACFEGRQLLALGDWTNRTHVPEERMRLHYLGARATMAMRVKHICLDMLKELGHYESWDVIPQETLEKAQTRSLARADRALSRPAYSLARPRCGGGFLTKHLRNGQALCVKFQTGRCSSREMQHKCAALMQTGRACGGAHPAAECRSKRMLKEPPVQRAAEGPSSVPVLPELKAVAE